MLGVMKVKIRKFFVSNSSSSSFICDICGEETIGRDISLEDAEMVQCRNGHYFCEHHIVGDSDKILEVLDDEDNPNYDEEWRWYFPIEHCPICQMEVFEDVDILRYMLKSSNKSQKDVENEIKSSFKSYDEFMTFIKGE